MGSGSQQKRNYFHRRRKGDYRRRGTDRRLSGERRRDRRGEAVGMKQSLTAWIRNLIRPRLGVDRRKGFDQRSHISRRNISATPIVTQEELNELLK